MKFKQLFILLIFSIVLAACGDSDDNGAPTVSATSVTSLAVGTVPSIQLTATATDPENNALTFAWTQVSGSTAIFDSTNQATVNVTPSAGAAETLVFNVLVTDSGDLTSNANVTVAIPDISACVATLGNITPVSLVAPDASSNYCQISDTLTEDTTLTNDTRWFLEGGLMIGNAESQAILSIEAGTSIRGDNVGGSDYVFVYPGSSIQSNGTGANPVIFSSDDDGYNGPAEWGGLFIRGDGDAQGDNLLDYTVVAEGGYPTSVAGTTYSDNIVVNGADDGTRFTFVQSHDSNRDGIRLMNTSARLSWILATGATRDGIWYNDFSGLVKDLMVIHRPDSGRSGIYASASTNTSTANPRFVNVTLVGRDDSSESAAADSSAREFGILFADNVRNGRYANIVIANFRNGCYEVEPSADISGLSYIDGIHCANEQGANANFGVVRAGGVDTAGAGIGNGDGIRYYNGVTSPVTFTGETAAREFTAGWYLNTIGSLTNGLAGTNGATNTVSATILNAFRNGDTNGDGNVDSTDLGATPFLGTSGPALVNPVGSITGFNDDVAADTGGYDLTHVGAVRSGADANAAQFNNWTVQTGAGEGFAVPVSAAPTVDVSDSQVSVEVGQSAILRLSAVGSTTPAGAGITYQWIQDSGTTVTINNADAEQATFNIGTTTVAQTLTFTLIATNSVSGATSSSTVSVFVPAVFVSSCPATVGNLSPIPLVAPDAVANNCEISGNLTADGILTNANTWFLEGGLMIGNAESQAILSIEAGTSIRGDNVGGSDYVFVYPGSSIQSNGTGANPVIFSSDDDGYNGPAEWGGLFIRGDGDAQGDNLLDYTVVAEGGYPTSVAGTTYSDNIVVNGADDGTRFTFVQSHDSNRDGIRLMNTSARLSWILATGATRDGIWYNDFSGLVKDLMVIHRPDSGRSGIYASASTNTSTANPRFVNVTLVGRDDSSESATADSSAREFGILFADNVRNGRYANIVIANFRNGCYEVEPSADISGLSYIDGIHCANEQGANANFGVVRAGGVDTAGAGIGNGDGIRYYNGVTSPVTFTGETAAREFTAGWYLNTIGSLTNGLAGTNGATNTVSATILNAFRNGDTNGDGNVDSTDLGATPFLGTSGPALVNPVGSITGFNDDVAADTGGYDLTHVGAVRSGADANAAQFNNWTVQTDAGEGFAVPAPQ